MAVRYRKYFQQCKPIQCTGRRSRQCPETPKRSNGEYKACGVWCLEFFDDQKQWQSLTFKDIRNKTDAEKRLTLFISDRERGQLNLPKKRVIPTLTEYSKAYLELYRDDKANTLHSKKVGINNLVKYLGAYNLDKVTPFIIEKYRLERREKSMVKDGTINDDVRVLSHIFATAIKEGILDKNPCKEVKKLKVTQLRDKILSQAVVIRYSERFSVLFKSLGISNFTFHNLRHTFSSLLQSELGIGAVVVQGMTGHSSLGMLQRYSHTGLNNKKIAIDALTNHVLNTSKEKLIRLESKTGTA